MTDSSNQSRVVVYTAIPCGYCRAAKQLLSSLHIPFEEVDLTHKDAERRGLVEQYDWRTVPLILIDGELIGGFTELVGLKRQGKLDSLAGSGI